jgi:hypothetical protein
MRVIRPAGLAAHARRRLLLLAVTMLATGTLGIEVALLLAGETVAATGVAATAGAVALGVGIAWLMRVIGPNRHRSAAEMLENMLEHAFDDDYTLVLAPQLPVREGRRLDGLLVGPAGVRALTVRDWEGRYRVRGRGWEFDAGRRRGWIPCRTNPSFDAARLGEGVARWASSTGLHNLPIRGAVAFPLKQSRIVLEEPEDEIVTADNTPWWANAIGRVRRLDPSTGAAFVSAVLDAADPSASQPSREGATAAAGRARR